MWGVSYGLPLVQIFVQILIQLWAAGSYSSEGISPIVAYLKNVKVSPF